jgi:hypothetical protein
LPLAPLATASALLFFQALNPVFQLLPRLRVAAGINVARCVVNVLVHSGLLCYQI